MGLPGSPGRPPADGVEVERVVLHQHLAVDVGGRAAVGVGPGPLPLEVEAERHPTADGVVGVVDGQGEGLQPDRPPLARLLLDGVGPQPGGPDLQARRGAVARRARRGRPGRGPAGRPRRSRAPAPRRGTAIPRCPASGRRRRPDPPPAPRPGPTVGWRPVPERFSPEWIAALDEAAQGLPGTRRARSSSSRWSATSRGTSLLGPDGVRVQPGQADGARRDLRPGPGDGRGHRRRRAERQRGPDRRAG